MSFPSILTGSNANAALYATIYEGACGTANSNAEPTPSVQRFEVGQVYATRSLCDYDCIYRFTVTARTDKTVTLGYHGQRVRRKVFIVDGVEWTYPLGSYSMCPIIRASKGDIE